MATERKLLSAALALNAGFIERAGFVAAGTLWASDQARPLPEVPVELGKLDLGVCKPPALSYAPWPWGGSHARPGRTAAGGQ